MWDFQPPTEGTIWVKVTVLLTRSWPTLCNPVGCSPLGSSVYGVFQARTLEWVATPSSRGSSPPRDWTQASCYLQSESLRWGNPNIWLRFGNNPASSNHVPVTLQCPKEPRMSAEPELLTTCLDRQSVGHGLGCLWRSPRASTHPRPQRDSPWGREGPSSPQVQSQPTCQVEQPSQHCRHHLPPAL